MDFVHLQCQSEYSVKNSLVRVSNLVERVKEAGMKSIALTDDMSLFSAIKFYQKAINSGIKPIIGAKITVNQDDGIYDVILLCQNHEGYLNLSELISKAYLNEKVSFAVSVSESQLIAHNKGLLTPHECTVGTEMARIVTGGEVAPGTVMSEQDLFDAERDAFLRLAKTPETQVRIITMLDLGSPVRN